MINQKSQVTSRKRRYFIVNLVTVCLCVFVFYSFAHALNLDRIKVYFLNGDYKSAITEGERALASTGYTEQLDELYYILGLSYLKDGNYLRSSDIFEIILKEFPNSRFKDEAKLGLGDSYFLRGDFEQAEFNYKSLISVNPDTKYKGIINKRLRQIESKKANTETIKELPVKIKEEKIPSDLPQDLCYTVQVGSFASNTNAINLTQKLIQNGYPAYLEEVTSSLGEKAYKVRVGKLSLKQEAEDLQKKLSQEGYPTKIFP